MNFTPLLLSQKQGMGNSGACVIRLGLIINGFVSPLGCAPSDDRSLSEQLILLGKTSSNEP